MRHSSVKLIVFTICYLGRPEREAPKEESAMSLALRIDAELPAVVRPQEKTESICV